MLTNGKVLIAGGVRDTNVNTLSSAELFDPVTATFTATGSMTVPRYNHTATLLPNGKVLIVGGYNATSNPTYAELYDPATGTFTATGALVTPRDCHGAALLSNGKVLVAAGFHNGDSIANAELYDPASGTFAAATPLITARRDFTTTLLSNGKVLIAGGDGCTTQVTYLAAAELYDPDLGKFASAGSMTSIRTGHSATLLANGKILLAGGWNAGVDERSARPTHGDTVGRWQGVDRRRVAGHRHRLAHERGAVRSSQWHVHANRFDEHSKGAAYCDHIAESKGTLCWRRPRCKQ
jgi:N-acetylneuraminic acid mutarotase